MKPIKQKQNGFALVEVIIVIIVIAVIGGAGYFILEKNKDTQATSSNAQEVAKKSEVKIKHLGVNLDTYNPATNKAGDFEFTKENMAFNMLFFDYGFVVPASSAGSEKKNPQPTFILPLGTKVYALVDGEVFDVPKLYSNDYSVMVKGEGSELIFETEHVINVKVKKGDKVKAGDVIAEVSDYDAKNYAGLGLVEIGVLKGGNPPSHVCPFDYLDDSIKDSTLKKITALQKSWEEYRGDDSIYDESKVVIPGCLTRDPIEG
jgi:prepilin-type N-terminal cleavage/methylation domain-containing protein